jgi:sulfur-oxidizing protein SoxY
MLAGIFTGVKTRSLLALGPSETVPGQASDTLNELHTPKLIVPAMTRNGAHVPIVVKMNHPMEPNHYIGRIEFLNESDPIPSKGIFYPTPANAELYFSFQARMHSGTSNVLVIAECNLHGRQAARHRIMIPDGQGGCATAGSEKQSSQKEEILPPVIRIPELVRRGRLAKGTTTEVQVKFKHPSKTGLAYENKKFVQIEEPLYLTSMRVFYGNRLVSRYEMTPGLSDNPFLSFKLKFTEATPIHILLTNSRGQEFSTVTEVVLS